MSCTRKDCALSFWSRHPRRARALSSICRWSQLALNERPDEQPVDFRCAQPRIEAKAS
jgi:hypothetical protein